MVKEKEVKRNQKAEALMLYLKDIKMDQVFGVEDVKDEFNSTVLRSFIDVEGQRLPLGLIIDETIYVIARVQVGVNVIKKDNKIALIEYLNEMNRSYKVFKYFLDDAGDIYIDACIPSLEEEFKPQLVQVILDVIVEHLNENYSTFMKKVWG